MSSSIQRVWLILAKVTVIGENPVGLNAGSEALVQCFVPEMILENALVSCDREGLRRIDVLRCESFEEIDPEDDVPGFVKRDVLRARDSGQALTGTFFTSEDSATFPNKPEE